MAGKYQAGEGLGRANAVVTLQWAGLRAVALGLALVTGMMIGVPVITAVERLSLDLEVILQSAALPGERR